MANGLYLYCLAEGNEKINFGNMGVDENKVYTIAYQDLCAIVHDSPITFYKSENDKIVTKWIIAHQKTIDAAWQRFGTILPLGFSTIIKGEEGIEAKENLKRWIHDDYENLKQKLTKVKGKAEYGIQIFWFPKLVGERLIENDSEINKLNEEIKSKSRGLAYMYKQKLEKLLRKKIEEKATSCFKDFYDRIKKCVDEIKVERTKKPVVDKQMLLNFSCLLPKENIKILSRELIKIDHLEEFSVRFTGPWAPYSFV